ncbi:cold-regulated 413 plasma membrane protein 2-like [Andrographis paniculata]|uniref:cold-regulated 413 plasma membrane protein 2-like n=1 Tax=Andrographis paniculata TaxID=175694 RepID=UPI0021E8873D|nr:cold-regulated 413 plasma membrane protein 2-like [Andrographis paniculata]
MKAESAAGLSTQSMASSDLKHFGETMVISLVNDASAIAKLGEHGVATSLLRWVAALAAIYLLILDRTNWRTNIYTTLLIPYLFFTLPSLLFNYFRGEVGKWFALIAVVLRLFFPRHFPDWLELPGSLILLLVVAPDLLAYSIRGNVVGVLLCLVIGCYLLHEHVQASGGLRNSFTKKKGIWNSIGILMLFIYPVWAVVVYLDRHY